MGKASRTKADRRSQGSVADARKKTDGRPWVFPVVVGGVVVVAVILIAVFAIGGGDDSDTAADSETPTDAQSLIGEPAPPLSGPDLVDGATASLTDFRGKPTLVVFWAHWCPHCQQEMPRIEELWESSNDEFNVVSAATWEGNQPASQQYADSETFIENVGLTMPTIDDTDDSAAQAWGLTGTPGFYVLNEDLVVEDVPPASTSNEQLRLMLTSG